MPRIDEIGLEYDEPAGEAPVQAVGTLGGRVLLFHARHGEWTFEVGDQDGNLPSDGYAGWIRRGRWPESRSPERIIEECARKFHAAHAG